jgi:hypothetical protein
MHRTTGIEEIEGFSAEGLWLETLIVPQSQVREGICSLVTSRPGAKSISAVILIVFNRLVDKRAKSRATSMPLAARGNP